MQDRLDAYKQLEEMRKAKLLVYVTGDRPNMGSQIESDVLPLFTTHLDKIGDTEKISLYIYTRGGNTLAAWSLVNLIRNFCKDFEVIIPSNCHSSGTLISLGANRIIMTKQATLGPIDPSVNGPLNPIVPGIAGNLKVPVSVEFINGYLEMARTELNITDEVNLTNLLLNLASQIHPLTLGQVYRSKSQIQMLAKRLIKYQQLEDSQRDEVIRFLCSESGSHDYTIHRREAAELGLKVEKPDDALYKLIQAAFLDIEKELQLNEPFDPKVMLASSTTANYSCTRALVESIPGGSHSFKSEGLITRHAATSVPGALPQTIYHDSRQFEGWKHKNIS
jgi:hypothetical protein